MRVGAPAFIPQVKAAIDRAVDVAVAGGRERAGLDDILLGILDDATALGARTVRAITTDVAAIEAAARRGVSV